MQRHDRASARAALRSSAAALVAPALLALLFAALAACDKGPARECDANFLCPDPFVCDLGSSTCVDPDDGVFCTKDSSCTDPKKAFCFVEASICVPCITQGSNNECFDRLICTGQRTCVACETDDECIGDTAEEETVCLRSGGCAKQSDVAYVSADGMNNTTCLEGAPCNSLLAALATNRPYIRLRGDFTLTEPLAISQTVSIFGNKASRNRITNPTGSIFTVNGSGTVEIRDLELSGAMGDAITVTSGSPKLDLDRVDLVGNQGVGVSAGTASLTMTRVLVLGNRSGGVTSTVAVTLENNIIANNGSATSIFGGLQLAAGGAASIVRFNTFANNTAQGAAGRSVSCTGASVTLSSNIFADATPQVNNCITAYSLFPDGTAVSGTDKEGDPDFEEVAPGTIPVPLKRSLNRGGFKYYHLGEDSAALGLGEPLGENIVPQDFDEDSRGGEDKDIGADELE